MKLFHKQKKDSGGEKLLQKINGRSIQYAVERFPDATEHIIGRDGRIAVTSTEIVIMCDGKDVFRCLREGAQYGELMSLDGIRIRGADPDGQIRTVIAHYTYYR